MLPLLERHGAQYREDASAIKYRRRVKAIQVLFALGFVIVVGRMGQLSLSSDLLQFVADTAVASKAVALGTNKGTNKSHGVAHGGGKQRPTLRDRHGVLLATNVPLLSLYANTNHVQDIAVTAALLAGVFSESSQQDFAQKLTQRLSRWRGVLVIKKHMSLQQYQAVHDLGLPGMVFRKESLRLYPHKNLVSHAVGFVNHANQGKAGFEWFLDRMEEKPLVYWPQGMPENVHLSLDIKVQGAVHEILRHSIKALEAKAGGVIVMDIHSGEILAMVSLPDFDANTPGESLHKKRLNRMTFGRYEIGSVFKIFTLAAALEHGQVRLEDAYDVGTPLMFGQKRIMDGDKTHALGEIMTAEDILVRSSNIGIVRVARSVAKAQRLNFLENLGFMDRPFLELLERGLPDMPAVWREVNMATAAYGHGISVTPLQVARAGAAIINGGILVTPTLIKKNPEQASPTIGEENVRVISPRTSALMRATMRKVVTHGTAQRAVMEEYAILGKTGTAEKATAGAYDKRQLLTSFLAAFPAHKPRYLVLTLLDSPQKPYRWGKVSASSTAVPVTADIIRRIAPWLGQAPHRQGLPRVAEKKSPAVPHGGTPHGDALPTEAP